MKRLMNIQFCVFLLMWCEILWYDRVAIKQWASILQDLYT